MTVAPTWDLGDLFQGPDDPELEDVLASAMDRANAFAERWRGRVAELDAGGVASLLRAFEDLSEPLRRAGTYAQLRLATDAMDDERQALASRVDDVVAAMQAATVFVELELLALDDARAEALAADPATARWHTWLRTSRRYKPHALSEPEERILAALGPTGPGAWQRLFMTLTATIELELRGEQMPIEQGLSCLHAPDRSLRDEGTQAISEALATDLDTRATVLDTLVADKAIRDGLRGYEGWLSSRNLDNLASDEQVEALVSAVAARYDLVGRWYRLKGRLSGIDDLGEHDRYAPLPLGEEQDHFTWDEARELVLDAYADFSGEAADIARLHFDRNWIDARPGPGKQPGAFCAGIPAIHPWINLSFNGTARDVMTIAHELGHGIHGWLSRDVPPLSFEVPLTMAETASVFGETVTFRRLAARSPDQATTLRLLASRIDNEISTIFRQVAMHRFEEIIHTERRERGRLSAEFLSDTWLATQREMFDGALAIGDRYGAWWSYVPHFVAAPGYVYAYAFGNLLSFALLQRYEADPEGFVPAYLAMLAQGGNATPDQLLAPFEVDLADPGFWSAGLAVFERLIDEAEELAAKL